MSIFIELNRWIHGGINLLSNGDRNRGRTCIKQMPYSRVRKQLHGPFKCAPTFDGCPLKLLRMLEPSRCGISHPKVDPAMERSAGFGERIICYNGAH